MSITLLEVAALVGCGVLAVIAVAAWSPPLRMPGHAILRCALPMAAGLALVPRQHAGGLMSAGALLAAAVIHFVSVGTLQPAALASVLALGPAIDVALREEPTGRRLHARFALAGAMANLLAWGVRFGAALWFGSAGGNRVAGHGFLEFPLIALVSFMCCGALAGLLGAALWFKAGPAVEP